MDDKYNIKPKPTFYNGIWYRSRLEARWACFFEFLRFDYEYEPEPFNTWSPDFVIHDLNCYVEIKPFGCWEDEMMNKILPYSESHRILLLSDEIRIESNKFYLGKMFSQTGDLRLIDFSLPYSNGFNSIIILRLWNESQNKVMYLKPE